MNLSDVDFTQFTGGQVHILSQEGTRCLCLQAESITLKGTSEWPFLQVRTQWRAIRENGAEADAWSTISNVAGHMQLHGISVERSNFDLSKSLDLKIPRTGDTIILLPLGHEKLIDRSRAQETASESV